MAKGKFFTYLMYVESFITLRNKIGLLQNSSGTIKRHEELNMLLHISPDVKVQQAQREKMAIMGFLATPNTNYVQP